MADNRNRKYSSSGSTRSRRSKSASSSRTRKNSSKNKNRENLIKAAISAILVVLVVVVAANTVFAKKYIEVFIGDVSVGITKNSKSITEKIIKDTVEAQLKDEYGTNISLTDEITIKKVRSAKNNESSVDYIVSKIKEQANFQVEASVIYVNGQKIAVLSNQETADYVINMIYENYLEESSEIIDKGFAEDVSVVTEFVSIDELISHTEAYSLLTATTKQLGKYTVQEKDSFYKIAQTLGTTVADILSANEGFTETTTIRPGQEINVWQEVPFLSVKTVERVQRTETELKTVEYREDSTKDKSYTKIVQQGSDGQKNVTVDITKINGVVQSETVVSEEVIQAAVPEILVVGTK